MLSARLWITIVTAAVANAVSLGVAAWVLDGFTLTLGWWVAAVVLFTVLSVVLRTLALRLLGPGWLRVYTIAGGLAVTALALVLTDAIVPSPGFDIDGWGTWAVATLIVWATGYRTDHSWIDVPGALDERGRLRQVRGVTQAAGLYTLGLPWQHTRGSALLGWVGSDAAFVAAQIDSSRTAITGAAVR